MSTFIYLLFNQGFLDLILPSHLNLCFFFCLFLLFLCENKVARILNVTNGCQLVPRSKIVNDLGIWGFAFQ